MITNIGVAHMENLGSRDGILKAKTEMLDYMDPDGVIILNGDDDKLRGFTPQNGIAPVYFGLDAALPYHAEQIESRGLRGTDAVFVTPSSSFSAHISIPGSHMVHNALAGIAVGYALGMNDGEIARGIEANVPIAGRNNLISGAHYTIIDDCYNANPASMKSSLDVLACADTRTVAILGDMFELGVKEKEMHYDTGIHAAEAGINVLICIGELSGEIARGAADACKADGQDMIIRHYASKADFFKEMPEILEENDTILVKASHSMEFPEIVDRLKQETKEQIIYGL